MTDLLKRLQDAVDLKTDPRVLENLCAEALAALRSQGESSTEPAAWLVCWHRANGDSGLDAYVNEDAARRAAKNLEAYSASETMADVQPLYTAPTPSPAESITAAEIWSEFVGLCEALESEGEIEMQSNGDSVSHFGRGKKTAAKAIRRSVVHPKYRALALSREGHDPDAGLPTAADVRGILSSTDHDRG